MVTKKKIQKIVNAVVFKNEEDEVVVVFGDTTLKSPNTSNITRLVFEDLSIRGKTLTYSADKIMLEATTQWEDILTHFKKTEIILSFPFFK